MDIRIITEKITRAEALEIGKKFYAGMVKRVADVEREIIALGGEYHTDANEVLIKQGSSQNNVWGFNLYPNQQDEEWIEFKSLINIRPQLGNRSLLIEDEELRERIRGIIKKRVI